MDKFIDLNFFNLKNTSFIDETFSELNSKLFKIRSDAKNNFRKFSKIKKRTNEEIIRDIINAEKKKNKKPYFNFFYSLYSNNTDFYQNFKNPENKKYYLGTHYLENEIIKKKSIKVLDNFFEEGEIPLYTSRISFFKESIKYYCIIILFFVKYFRSLE